MASYSPAPASPTAAAAAAAAGQGTQTTSNAQNATTHRSATPPTATASVAATATTSSNPLPPQSKRDKRRTALQDRLQEITATFSENRDSHFRQQLHALQYDMGLIANADLYDVGPLDDSAEGIGKLIDKAVAGGQVPAEMKGLAGRWYARFVQEVNRTKEEKDVELAMLMNRHEHCVRSIKRDRDFRSHLASEECNQLAQTLRERLVQVLSQRKARMMKEKEQLDIADSNALLLHPNQFSITNPASPGGLQSNRKTRHTRHRVDIDELGNGIASEPANKRKRKAPADDDLGSPIRDGGATTPAERAKTQHAPLYNLNSLFTDKELSLHLNNAHIATAHFFAASKQANNNNHGATPGSQNTDGEDTPAAGDATEDNNATPAAAAQDMERTVSQQTFHATRSTRNQGATALNLLGELADKTATRPPIPYFSLANYPTGRTPLHSIPPTGLMEQEADDDLAKIDRLMSTKPEGWIDRNLIEQVLPEGYAAAQVGDQSSNLGGMGSLDRRFPPLMDVHLLPVRKSGGSSVAGSAVERGGGGGRRQRMV